MICGTGEGSGFQFLHEILQWEVFYKSIDMNPASLSSLQLDFCSEDGPGMLVLASTNYVSSSGCTQKEQYFTLHIFLEDTQCGGQLLPAFFYEVDEHTSQLSP